MVDSQDSVYLRRTNKDSALAALARGCVLGAKSQPSPRPLRQPRRPMGGRPLARRSARGALGGAPAPRAPGGLAAGCAHAPEAGAEPPEAGPREPGLLAGRRRRRCGQHSSSPARPLTRRGSAAPGERECCLLVLNLVSFTLPCIRRPRPRLRVLDVCGFV